jgi:GT2 family glycosyltransferase
MKKLVATIVTYNNDPKQIIATSESFLQAKVESELNIVDNASTNNLLTQLKGTIKANLLSSGANKGFGAGHNFGIKNSPASEYYLVLNPDVIVPEGELEKMISYLDKHQDIALLIPKVLNKDGSLQDHHRTIPNIKTLFIRRFLPFIKQPVVKFDSTKIQELEVASGCFMLFRRKALEKINGFDEGFFMYFEDIDITLRTAKIGKVIYYPKAKIIHLWERASHKNWHLTFIHIKSALYFFFKLWAGKYK